MADAIVVSWCFERDLERTSQFNSFAIFFSDSTGPLSGTVPAIVGLLITLSILLLLFCFMFKLFTQSRWARARAYADAGQPPPTITLEGTFT